MNEFKVSLENFEGPLDLLLYLIKKEEMDIYEISIAEITKEYKQWVEYMERLNFNRVGEFMYILALLMGIKSRMLLFNETEEIEEDPVREIRERLAIYEKFLNASFFLKRKWELASNRYTRKIPEVFIKTKIPPEIIKEAKRLFKREKTRVQIPVGEAWDIEKLKMEIMQLLKRFKGFSFLKKFRNKKKSEKIGAFFVLLELAKLGIVKLNQRKPFGEIWVRRRRLY